MNPLLLTDGYKLGHHKQYPENTTLVYSNWTPRKSRVEGVEEVVFFGLQYFIKEYLIDQFQQYFFQREKEEVLQEYKDYVDAYLNEDYDVSHIGKLHDLGYLPIEIKALEEGTSVPIRTPMFTMKNTLPEFYWLTNYLETLISNSIWLPCNSATIARKYHQVLCKYALETNPEAIDFVTWQGHDFSMRGMAGKDASILSGMAHAVFFNGSDTLPVSYALKKYYHTENVIGSVNATEHSVMCAGNKENELETFQRLLQIYPKGILSIVSDTWDLWKVISEFLPKLKQEILERDGKVVIRPDSGDPVLIICGNPESENELERKGVVQLLWEIFGGIENEQGFKVLNPKIGAIYGDSITMQRAEEICERLKRKGFASTNIVLGIGSFTYQYNTRDTFGFAMKTTYVEVNGEKRNIFKDPITDNGTKKSAKGLLKIYREEGKICFKDTCTEKEEKEGMLETVFKNGILVKEMTLAEIRSNVTSETVSV
ncbi:nicotinate phosphoribosyltransferase [Aureivirga sp. CE67]|uniref:nicotinate phosphoribosyltransferase n=1 Tax=Aureivirga sp. CE67 TaxID=1788983 RepID=UPI0018C96C99|nr:nicotinate phosphoribosyltransferase [Aureivirga sp. CE67]